MRKTILLLVTAVMALLGLPFISAPATADTMTVDRSFGTDGVAKGFGFGGVPSFGTQANGAVVLTSSGSGTSSISRLTPAGQADGAFGSWGSWSRPNLGIKQLVVGADDSIYAIGQPIPPTGTMPDDYYVGTLIKLDSNGASAPGFGQDGMISLPFLPVDIKVAGGVINVLGRDATSGKLARFNLDGTRVASFGDNGTVAAKSGTLVIDSSNRPIVLGGNEITRFAANGAVDGYVALPGLTIRDKAGAVPLSGDRLAFVADSAKTVRYLVIVGAGGDILSQVEIKQPSVSNDAYDVRSLRLRANGKLLLHDGFYALRQFNNDGSVDTSFGDGGVMPGVGTLFGMEIDPQGRVLIPNTENMFTWTMHRYLLDGTVLPRPTVTLTFAKDSIDWGVYPEYTVTVTSNGQPVNVGRVSFYEGDTELTRLGYDSGMVVNGVATGYLQKIRDVRAHTIRAVYKDNDLLTAPNYATASSTPVTLNITEAPIPGPTTFAYNPFFGQVGKTAQWQVFLGNNATDMINGGTVSIWVDGVKLGEAPVVDNAANITVGPFTKAGETVPVTIKYSGNGTTLPAEEPGYTANISPAPAMDPIAAFF